MDQIAHLPRYESYRGSGADWLGQIPSNWSLESIRAVTQLKSEKNKPDLQVLSVYREYGVILKDSRDDNHNATSLDTSGYKVVNEGDLVVNKMKAWQGSMGVSEHNGIVSPAYITCRVDAKRVHPKFLHYLLRSQPYISIYNALSYGVRVGQWDMHYEDFKRIPLPLPDRTCQQRIANFLDQKTAEIDVAIAKKQRLIELLKEQKAILINQAVTKGLSGGVTLVSTGNPFFPELPEGTSLVKLGYLCNKVSDGPHFSPSYVDDGVMFLSAGNIRSDRWLLENVKQVSERDYREFCKRVVPEVGDVLYTKGGTTGVAKVVDLTERFQVWVHVAVLKLQKKKVNPNYLAYALNSVKCYEQSQLFTRGATNKDLGLTRMINIVLPLPSLGEQAKIVASLDKISAEFSKLSGLVVDEMGRLEEYRSILISEAVTGKIKL